jgi:DNA-binding response OmpR family regulator
MEKLMANQLKTLVVDDEHGIRFFLTETLRRSGHVVSSASSGEQALDVLRDNHFDLILLDLKLGGAVDGLRVLEAVKWRWPDTAVVMLTAHGSLDSAVAAIGEGVDGYLLKPVKAEDVRQAVEKALARRKPRGVAVPADDNVLRRGDFKLDIKTGEATLDGAAVELTPYEYALLRHLMENSDRVVSPRELVEVVRDYRPEGVHEARDIIKWYIYRLRQKVERDASRPRHILNVRGVGYTFKP